MSVGEISFLAMVIGALALFAGVLAWAMWMEHREARAIARRTGPAPQDDPKQRAF